MGETIAIIGAGVAGLAAGCYAQMNGFRTRIFESQSQPGGLCTTWRRGEYAFDGCIRWLVGSASGSAVHQMWLELGALQGRRIHDADELTRIEGRDGRTLVVYRDADRLEQHLSELSPADAALATELCDAIRLFARLEPRRGALGSPADLLAAARTDPELVAHLRALRTWGELPLTELAGRFRDPFLRHALPLVFDMRDFPVLGALTTLGWMHNRAAGYPIGGSLELARAIERRYVALGGELRYRARVERIGVANARATGVVLTDGTELPADVVISAADGHTTIFDMLGARYADESMRRRYEARPTFPSFVQVSLGVARDLSSEPASVRFPLSEPIAVAGVAHESLLVRHYCYDETMAPAGKSAVVVSFDAELADWTPFARDRARYEAEKNAIATQVIAALDRRLPGFARQVEVVDVATPRTIVRYTGNWRGSTEGWLLTTSNWNESMSGTLPGLGGLYMVGQWVEPGGGVPAAAGSARKTVSTICRELGRDFRATLPG